MTWYFYVGCVKTWQWVNKPRFVPIYACLVTFFVWILFCLYLVSFYYVISIVPSIIGRLFVLVGFIGLRFLIRQLDSIVLVKKEAADVDDTCDCDYHNP